MLGWNVRRVFYWILLILVVGVTISGCQIAVEDTYESSSQETPLATETPALTETPTQTFTPTPTSTTGPPPTLIPQTPPATRAPVACQDDAELVIDLSLQQAADGALPVLPATSPVEKGWRVENTGTCTWDSSYYLAPAQVAPDWSQPDEPVAVEGRILPGEMADFWAKLQAPLLPGVYQADYLLHNGRGVAFGSTLGFGIEVAALPTGTPLPDFYLVASPLEVAPGEEAAIAWATRKAKAAYLYRSGQAWQEHPVGVNGSIVVEPERTTTYELRTVNGDDTVEVHHITIEVVPFDPPKIRIFKFEPADIIDLGQCVDIFWQITGRVNTVTVLRNGVQYWTTKAETGDTWDCPTASGRYRYTLQAVGPGGSVEAAHILEVR